MNIRAPYEQVRAWVNRTRAYSLAEIIADGIVHGVGLALSLALGAVILIFAARGTARAELPALILYVGSLLVLFAVSMAFNLAPASRFKQVMARIDQAAIFLFIAGTYTPFLALLWGTVETGLLTVLVWGAALVGIALKLLIPERFGRLAIVLYLAIGWSGVMVFHSLAATLPPMSFWLLLAGGVAYSAGIVFHLWDRLRFQNVLWHLFVLAGASLHLFSILDAMVLSRL